MASHREERTPSANAASTEGAMGTACIALDIGCPRMTVDVALLFEYVKANGWEVVDDVTAADLIFAACCAVHEGAEQSGFESLAHIDARRRKGSRLIVVGCLPGICHERLSAAYPDAVAVPPARIDELDDLIDARVKLAEIPEVKDRAPYEERARRSRNMAADSTTRRLARGVLRATGVRPARQNGQPTTGAAAGARVCSLRVAWGCANECTYCAIRIAAGPLRSKPREAILAEFDAGLAEGFTRFEVIAGDVGCWGQDVRASIVDLLTSMFERSGEYQLIIDDFNPRWLLCHQDALVPLLAANAGKVEALVLPVQSGSEQILARMQRGYAASELRLGLTRLREAAEDLNLITHVLVGFPGEGEAEFEETRALLESVRFDRVDAYPYADRPNALSGRLPGKVPQAIIEARCARLVADFPTVVADCR
jgi:tRNA A37 methylthiotransferase MiaB